MSGAALVLAGPAGGQRFPEPGPGPAGPGQTVVDVDAVRLHAERGKCVALGGEVLGVGGAAGVSDEHAGHRMTVAAELPQALSVEATPSLKAVGDVPAIGFGCWRSVSGRGERGTWSQTVRPGRRDRQDDRLPVVARVVRRAARAGLQR